MATSQHPAFGTLLRRHRLAAGLTQEELAERAQVSRRSIGDMERGVAHRPRRDTVALLAAALTLASPDQAAFADAARRVGAPASATDMPPSGSEPPFVGRARELALLDRHLAGEGPPLLLLAGEPGIGKTRLLRAAVSRGAGDGLRVLEGGCQRSGGHEPYAPLLGALQRHLRGQRLTRLRAELAGCAWLVRMLPELAAGPIEPLPAWTLPPAQERRLMVEAVVQFLANVAGPAGTLLVLDDLQWADPDALDLLATLVRSAPVAALRVIGAYRDTEVHAQDPLAVTLADLAHAGLAARRLLSPLAPQEAAQLVTDLLEGFDGAGPDPRVEILRRAGGVPFFVVSCAQELRAGDGEGDGALRRADPGIGPWAVAQSVRQRVAVLPEGARAILGAAAVVGRVVPHSLLGSVTGRPEAELFAALGAACRAGLLAEDGQTYQFTHDVIREVIEHDVGLAQRRALHRRAAEALERQPGEPPVELLAYHYSRAGLPERAVRYMEQAGDQARSRYAGSAAEAYYRDVLAMLEQPGSVSPEVGRVREKLGDVLMAQARYEEALMVLELAIAVYQAAADWEGVGRVTAQVAAVYLARGTPEEGIRRIEMLLADESRYRSPQTQAELYVTLAELLNLGAPAREQLVAAERAMELARKIGDPGLLGRAMRSRAEALYFLGRHDEASVLYAATIPLAEASDDARLLFWALHDSATLSEERGEFDDFRRWIERALVNAERLGDPSQVAFLTTRLGMAAFYSGDWAGARPLFERAVAMTRQINEFLGGMLPLFDLGRLCLFEGAWEEATTLLQEAFAEAEQHTNQFSLWEVQSTLAERDLLAGDAKSAHARLAPLLDSPTQWDSLVPTTLSTLAWALLERGDLEGAAAMVQGARVRASLGDRRLYLVEILRVQAMILQGQGRPMEARQVLDEGLAMARAMRYPYPEARMLQLYGLLDAKLSARPEGSKPAREKLEAALAIFRRLGARKDIEQAELLLSALC